MLFLNCTLKNCENQKKIDKQLVMSRTSSRIKHIEKGPKKTDRERSGLATKSEFFAGLNKIFSKMTEFVGFRRDFYQFACLYVAQKTAPARK